MSKYDLAYEGVTSAQDTAQSHSSRTINPLETDDKISMGDILKAEMLYSNQRIWIEK